MKTAKVSFVRILNEGSMGTVHMVVRVTKTSELLIYKLYP